jgi:hypothetical protein
MADGVCATCNHRVSKRQGTGPMTTPTEIMMEQIAAPTIAITKLQSARQRSDGNG